jgi:putative endonuclease
MYFVYILYSERMDKYYIGSTNDIEGRIRRHNTGNKAFTATGKPWVLRYKESFGTKSEALKREQQLKKWKNRERIESLISKCLEHPDM